MSVGSTSLIHPGAIIGSNVEIGEFCIIHEGVVIADNVEIGNYSEIGIPTKLASSEITRIEYGSLIRSGAKFYQNVNLGPNLKTGHNVTVRENSFAEKDLQLGTLTDIQGDVEFGKHVRLHSNVHIGKKARIGDYVWIYPYVVLTNDPHPPSETLIGVTVQDFAVIATMSVILPGVTIGSDSLVGAHSLVNKDVAPMTIVGGVPARSLGDIRKIKLMNSLSEGAYPWRKHFHRGYELDDVDKWKQEFRSEK